MAKDLSCFANTEGGVIVFGVRRDGERVGLLEDRMEALQQFIVNVSENNMEPPLGHLLLLDSLWLPNRSGAPKLCLKLEIKKSLFSVHAPKGERPYHRIADHCHRMSLDQQSRLFERRGMMLPFEERPVYTAPVGAITPTRFAEYYEHRYNSPLEGSEVSVEHLLENLKLATTDEAGELRPTALGILLFSSRPAQYLSGAYVDIVAYRGSQPDADNQLDAKEIHGSVVEQIERTVEYLRVSPLVPVPATKDGFGRLDQPVYSLRVLQEAVVNALVHRDYAIRSAQVRVFLFEDRIEISNPGRLYNTLTPEALYLGAQPIRRNQLLAGFLREYESPLTNRAYMEGRGEGFLVMVRRCEAIAKRRPELAIIGDSVRLTIYGRRDISGELP